MINLLPPNDKRQIRAGKSNVLLLRYCIASFSLAIPLLLLIVSAYIIMDNSKNTAQAIIQEGEARNERLRHVQQNAQEFRQNLSTAKTILDKEVKYSRVAVSIAQALPSDIYIQSLNLSPETFGQPIILSASGDSYQDAVRLKTSLERSEVFSNVYLISVSQAGGEAGGVTISISAVLNPEIV